MNDFANLQGGVIELDDAPSKRVGRLKKWVNPTTFSEELWDKEGLSDDGTYDERILIGSLSNFQKMDQVSKKWHLYLLFLF